MRSDARVVVIGGGAVGTAILYHLALAGVNDTLLLEKDELTSGSTWHAAGNIPTYANSWLGMRVGNYAWRFYKDLGDTVGVPITYRHTGAFWPAHTDERMELFQHLVGVSKSAGFELAMLTPADMEEMHPFYSARAGETGGVIGGIHDPYEGDIDPSQLTQALAKGARDLGAEVARFTPVTGVRQKPSGDWLVETDKGAVTAEIIVNAAGSSGGVVAAMAGLAAPVVTLQHQYLVTDSHDELAKVTGLFPLVRDPDLRFYLRRERDGFLFGSYAHEGRPVWPDGPPEDFAHQLFPDNPDDFADLLEASIEHVPLLGELGAKRFVNGPIPYAPDALPLVGPAFGVRNFYHATGVQVGILQSAAIGKAIAEWVTEGETEWDLSAWDPRRFGDWATPEFAAERAAELYGLQYAIPYPHRLLRAGRPVNRTPLYERLSGKGAVFGQIGGWERAMWFARDGRGERGFDHLSFRDGEPWWAAVRRECETVRDAVGVMDHGGFTKYEVTGSGARDYLDKVFCGALPKPGRVRLSYMLTPKGKLWSEATIACLDDDRFVLCGPTVAVDRDFDWLSAHLPDDGSVSLRQGAEKDGTLMVMGPKSRQLLAGLTEAGLSADTMPWMSVAEIAIAGVEAIAMRVSYVGELGWELHVASEDLAALYDAIIGAGQAFGLADFGSYALNAMRIEKGYHGWGADFGTEYTPFDAGLGRFVDFSKPVFIGREAVHRARDRAPEWAFWGFTIENSDADALPSDPILLDGELAGYVTSAGTGFRTGKRLAMGYLQHGNGAIGEVFEIIILGKRCRAVCGSPHVYDPDNERLRG